MPVVPPDILEWRRRTGADRWDEVWEGIIHMPPAPIPDHQDFQGALETFLRLRWARPRGAKVLHDINLAPPGGWPPLPSSPTGNYRIPDLVLLTPARFGIQRAEFFEGAPDVVVEIRSPGDETLEKLPFYAALGVPEVWIVDRDTKAPRVLVLEGEAYRDIPPGSDDWIPSGVGVELRSVKPGKLEMRLAGDDSTREELP